MDMNIEPSHIVEVSTAPSLSPKKLTVPLIGLERFPTQQEIEGQDARTRRPVRPIDRQRMRPWLMELLDMGNVFGLRWTNRHQGIFQISWRHASRLGWNLETDGDVFERWARHTGIYKEGDPPEPKRWKANFRCALHSLTDVLELTNAVERRGRNACRTYQFLQNSSSTIPKSKVKKQKAEVKVQRNIIPLITYEQPAPEPEAIDLVESASSDDLLSETESEGSQKDKVIVQRLEAKGQGGEEEYLLHHDHDYSAGPLKTQKTIYLRQGVGSIVLQKEITSAPDDGEEVKSYLLSNLDQLASAAVSSENITLHKSPVSGLVDIQANFGNTSRVVTPSKAVFDLTFNDNMDKTEYNLKSLLPRLRARIKESEKAGGLVRKRKGSNIDIDSELETPEPRGKIKKEKSDKDTHSLSLSPPSPPMTRRRSGSPKKAVKVVAKPKRTRKESDESTSDSTEPLMSSCLLLLEAATRLDNAEKNGSSSTRPSSKANKKAAAQSMDSPVDGKRRTSGRILRSDKHVEEQVLEDSQANNENVTEEKYEISIQDDMGEVSQEMVIEEEVYPEDAVQVIYETDPEQLVVTQADISESSLDASRYHEILRATLNNIGSELEVSTVESSVANSTPKEMAIMRRKRDPDKTSSSNVVEIPGNLDMSSSPKGLFSGSEIVNDSQQQLSIVRKRIKGKSKTSPKENIYYVDIRANGGSICVKQSDGSDVDEKESISSPLVKNAIGIQQTVIKRELPVLTAPHPQKMQSQIVSSANFLQTRNTGGSSPQIFIASTQNTTGQQVIVPISSGGLVTSPNSSAERITIQQADSIQVQQKAGQTNPGSSYITMGSHGKALLCKSDSTGKLLQRTTIIPLLNPVASSSPASTVKISTLPIMSSVKPSVNTSAPISSEKASDQTVLSNSVVPIKIVPKVSSHTLGNVGPTQLAAIKSGGKAWILQPRTPAPDSQLSKTTTIQMLSPAVIATGQPIIKAISSVKRETEKSILPISVNLTSSVSGLSKTSGGSLVSVKSIGVTKQANLNLPAQIVIDSVKGSVLQSSIAQVPAPQTSVLSGSLSSCLLSNASHSFQAVPVKTEISVTETVVSSEDILDSGLTNMKVEEPDSDPAIEPQDSSNSSVIHENFQSIPVDKDLEGTLIKIESREGNSSEQVLNSTTDFVSNDLAANESQGSTCHIVESITGTDASSTVAVDMIVESEESDQQIFISSEEEKQREHIIRMSDSVTSESLTPEMDVNELNKIDSISETETAVAKSPARPNVGQEEICLDINSKEEIVSQHHHREPLSMDPRTPLAIGEIPLFAASKGDLDYMGSPASD